MLNKQQKQFRKQMKEIERRNQRDKDIYSYREKKFTSEKRIKGVKKPLIQIGGGISLLVLLWNLYAFSSSVIGGVGNSTLLSADQMEVHQFIQQTAEIELALSEETVSLINRYNANTLAPFHIEEAQKKIFDLQKKIPEEDSRFLLLNSYIGEQFNLAYQLTNVLKTDESSVKHMELTTIVEKQNKLSKKRTDALMDVLENEGIPYEQLEDGSISYQYEV